MKKNNYFIRDAHFLLLVLVSLLPVRQLVAQGSATVYTPKGTAVSAIIFSEFNSAQIQDVNNQAAIQFPSAQRLADASATYNCHAYA